MEKLHLMITSHGRIKQTKLERKEKKLCFLFISDLDIPTQCSANSEDVLVASYSVLRHFSSAYISIQGLKIIMACYNSPHTNTHPWAS